LGDARFRPTTEAPTVASKLIIQMHLYQPKT
jgi:hypothetical protein